MAKRIQNQITGRFLKVIDQICTQMTAKDLCRGLSFSEPTLSSIKTGNIKSVKPEYIIEVCLKHHYSILWVMTGKGDMKADEATRNLQEEIKHIKEILGDIIVPLLNEVLTLKITYKPDKKNPLSSDAIKDLLKDVRKKSN